MIVEILIYKTETHLYIFIIHATITNKQYNVYWSILSKPLQSIISMVTRLIHGHYIYISYNLNILYNAVFSSITCQLDTLFI